jgi:opacity protein-like surface antigen
MRKLVVGMIAVAGVVGATRPAMAQGVIPLAVEGRVGAGFPTGDFGEDDDVGTGLGFGADAVLRVLPLVNVYGGWERYSFDGKGESNGTNVTDSGIRAGAQLSIPVGMVTGFSPFVSAGLLYNRTSAEATEGSASLKFTSDWKLGYELGAGISVPVAPALSVVPAVRYRSHDVSFSDLEGFSGTISYLSVEAGLKLGL